MTCKRRQRKSVIFGDNYNFAMKPNQQQMIASIVKEARIAKGYTQKELAEISNISIRSIQRIENAQLQPRSYTLKVLSAVLEVSFDNMVQPEGGEIARPYLNNTQKIILSVGCSLVCLALFWAFLSQSRFPETTFEFLLAMAVFLTLLMVILWYIWRTRK